ncbi:hypothetical protein NB693_21360 [Pantoea ananatis]|uniref:hypothetical protein n=1 Tax=Pantoea ananas TaxID=553 RepID=UPI002220CDE2|nr:hypothetical protein [Pantoea ananatis]
MSLRSLSRSAAAFALMLGPVVCVAQAADAVQPPPGYSGHGGMTAYSIKPDIYAYHYDHGFDGDDAMGWDPGLQFVWSRAAAAKACGVDAVPEKA